MKNVFFLLVALFFFSCQKNDILPVNDSEQASVLKSQSASSDVKVENGYLVVENFKVLDSISEMVAQMGELERLAWENKMNFESAHTHFKPYFEAFDVLETLEEMENYQQQNKAVIKVINDEECCDIDYPFQTRGRSLILSKDGKIKVGTSLWIFKADRKITIIDATEDRVNQYKDAVSPSEEEGVYIDYYNTLKTRVGQANNFISLTSLVEKSGKRWYYWSLDLYPEREGNETRLILALYQQGKKKKLWGNYNVYNTTYHCRVEELRINNTPVYGPELNRTYTSSEDRGGQYFGLIRSFYPADVFPNFRIVMTHGSRGLSASKTLDYEHTTPFPPTPNTQKIFVYSGI